MLEPFHLQRERERYRDRMKGREKERKRETEREFVIQVHCDMGFLTLASWCLFVRVSLCVCVLRPRG